MSDYHTRAKLGIPVAPRAAQPTPAPAPRPSIMRGAIPNASGPTGALPANMMQNPAGPQGIAQQLAQHNVNYGNAPAQWMNPLVMRGPSAPPPWATQNFQASSQPASLAQLMQQYTRNPLM